MRFNIQLQTQGGNVATKLKNYMLFCAGVDSENVPTRIIQYVYNVRDMDSARRIVRKDRRFRSFARKVGLDHKTVPLAAVSVNSKGETTKQGAAKQARIEQDQLAYIENLLEARRREHYASLIRE